MGRVLPLVTGNAVETTGGRLEVETPAWYAWLDADAVSFAFAGERGNFTARKEQRGKAGGYWKAYRKQAGKLHTAYLGRSSALTLGRLEEVAATLTQRAAQPDREPPAPAPSPHLPPDGNTAGPLGNSPELPLLATKLYLPAGRRALVPRPRLEAQLAAGLAGPVTLICAPAGFGKTTLLSGWLRASGRPVAWLTLDEQDTDPPQLVRYVLAALRTITPSLGESLLTLLAGPPPPMATLLTLLVNDLVHLPASSILVLDDYHVLQGQAAHQVLTFLVEHLPPHLHLAVATREDPPLPLARLRTRGQLCELRTADLRFTAAEAAEFLTRIMNLALSPAEVAALEARTEGWIAGLQLAALSMQGQQDRSGFIAAFTGSHRYVLDYLAAEVLSRLPAPVYAFILQTAILDRLCAPLCAALLNGADDQNAQQMLERLERANLFLEPLDNERRWYRYHRLFADLLRARLRQEQPAVLPDLHRRAAAWCAAHDLPEQAIEHALAGADYALVARLVSERVAAVQQPSRLRTMMGWLEALPVDFVRTQPGTALDYAGMLMALGRLDEVQPYLDLAWHALQTADAPGDEAVVQRMLGRHAAIATFVAGRQGHVAAANTQAQRALALLPADDLSPRAGVIFYLAEAYLRADDLAAADRAYTEAITLSRAAGNDYITLVLMNRHAGLQILCGRLHLAAHTARAALQLPGIQHLPFKGMAAITLGTVLAEWNRLDQAAAQLADGIRLLEPAADWNTNLIAGYTLLARVRLAEHSPEAARTVLTRAAEIIAGHAPGTPRAALERSLRREWVRFYLAIGDLRAALELAEQAQADQDPAGADGWVDQDTLLLAAIRQAQGQPAAARDLLTALLPKLEASGRTGLLIEALARLALALRAGGDLPAALDVLGRALLLAEPEGYCRVFLDAGPTMPALLREAQAQRDAPAALTRLLAAAGAAAAPTRPAPTGSSLLVEPLSDREREVLRLLAAGLAGPEIAAVLVVGYSTVKSHLKHIYSKLDVHTRREALARAKELQLL